jgi:hypothetical protein
LFDFRIIAFQHSLIGDTHCSNTSASSSRLKYSPCNFSKRYCRARKECAQPTKPPIIRHHNLRKNAGRMPSEIRQSNDIAYTNTETIAPMPVKSCRNVTVPMAEPDKPVPPYGFYVSEFRILQISPITFSNFLLDNDFIEYS